MVNCAKKILAIFAYALCFFWNGLGDWMQGWIINSLCNYITHLVFIDRLLGAVVVIAANAGGAWTPIGDVTTTMLWIHGQISTLETMKVFFILNKFF